MKFFVVLSLFFGFGFSHVFATSPAPPIRVQPEFRQTPIWYWQSPEKKCVPVPAYDVISRIAPEKLRQENINPKVRTCEIRVDDRQNEAQLQCEGRKYSTYYSKENLCQQNLNQYTTSWEFHQSNVFTL